MDASRAELGVVVIGRNEGERLRACLASLQGAQARVYVDSGSSDSSPELARAMGFDVVELPADKGFTAGTARNAGVEHIVKKYPAVSAVQTVDGDCEVHPDWLASAVEDMRANPDRAVVFGRRRERHPDRNAYHRACDIEWRTPAGEAASCGGDALFRVAAFREAGGFNPGLIAGEEPDLCLRLRLNGWRIWSNDKDMTWHDVAIDRFPQWWRRAQRAGFGIAEIVHIHGRHADASWRRFLRSTAIWTTVSVAAAASFGAFGLSRNAIFLGVGAAATSMLAAQVLRVAFKHRLSAGGLRPALTWSALLMASKLAQSQGAIRFYLKKRTKRRSTLIEYK